MRTRRRATTERSSAAKPPAAPTRAAARRALGCSSPSPSCAAVARPDYFDGGGAGDSGGPGATDANTDGGTDVGGCQGTCPAGFTKNGNTCTDDASAGWSGTLNPSGNWSYGSRASSADAFLPFGTHQVDRGITLWSPGPLIPNVGFNAGSGEVVLDGSTAWAPGQLSLHPAGGTTAGVLRWNAPSAGKYTMLLNAKACRGAADSP